MPTPAPDLPPEAPRAIDDLAPGDRRVLNENELAQRWGVSVKTLQRWRSEGGGPRFLKLSRRVSYPVDSVMAYEQFALFDSTSQRSSR